jgi:hypothetical protein
MTKKSVLFSCILWWATHQAAAQITLSGQSAAQFFQSASTGSARAVYNGHPSFGWETELFVDAAVADNIFALSTIRAGEGRQLDIEQAAIRLLDLTDLHLNVQAGKFDLPFGNLGERRYPRRNNLFSLPLIYEYRTALPNYLYSENYYALRTGHGAGMRLLDLGMYGMGAMVYGSEGMLDYAFSLSSGTVSSTSYQAPNSVDDLSKTVRLALTPITGLTIGAAYSWGAYLAGQYAPPPSYSPPPSLDTYIQKSAEADVEFSRGHFVFYGEGVYNTWPVPLESRDELFKAFGYYAEAKYTLIPRLYVALRVSGIRFGSVLLASENRAWDDDVTEWEGGAGYFLDRNVLVKLVRRETRIQGVTVPKDHLTVLQLAVSY